MIFRKPEITMLPPITRLPPMPPVNSIINIHKDVKYIYIFNKEKPIEGGYTVAYIKSNPDSSGRMVKLAVSFCVVGDSFCKKIGRGSALNKLIKGEYIQLPLRMGGDFNIEYHIRSMFQHL